MDRRERIKMIFARNLILIISTIIITLFTVILINETSIEISQILTYLILITSSGLFLYFIAHVLFKQKIETLINTATNNIDNILNIFKSNVDKELLEESYASLSKTLKAIILILIISSGSFVIFALLTNSILISNLIVNLNYTDKLAEQNKLANENNISAFTDRIEILNKQIEKKTKYQKTTFHLVLARNFLDRYPYRNDIIIEHDGKYYSNDIDYREDENFDFVKTCLSADEHCLDNVFTTISQIEHTKEGTEIININPYISSLLMRLKSSRLPAIFAEQGITFENRSDNIKFYDFFSDIQLQCGHKNTLNTSEIHDYLHLLNASNSIKFDFNNASLRSKKSSIEIPYITINKTIVDEKMLSYQLVSSLAYYTNMNNGNIYIDKSMQPDFDAVKYYKKTKDDYPKPTLQSDSEEFIDYSISNLLRNFYTMEKRVEKSFKELNASCDKETNKLYELKNKMNQKIYESLNQE
jgi:hypothetical protein